jgi:hypothetical protein
MERDRDLFRAIVIAGLAVTAGCSESVRRDDAGMDAGERVADAGGEDGGSPEDAGDEEEDGMVLIL